MEGELYPWWDIPWGWAKGHPLTLWPRVDRSEVDPGPTLGLFPLGLQELFSEGTKLIEERRGFSRTGVFVSRAGGRAETGQG